MTEEHLLLGRPPRPPRRGPWGGRVPRVVAGVVVAAVAGWAVWHGLTAEPATPPDGDTASTSSPVPSASPTGWMAYDPPAVPYLRSGTLVVPDESPRGIPDGSWTDFAVLTDGRLVLVQRGSLTVVGPDREQETYRAKGSISARPDGTAVAWTDPDGHVRQLQAHHVEPFTVPGARQLAPGCRGIRLHDRTEAGWQTCDRDGGPISPDGAYFASLGVSSVTIAPRSDITGGISAAFLGRVTDAVWEDSHHVLVVVSLADETHLQRVGLGGETEDLIPPPHGTYDSDHPMLVLPATAVQP
jgi:hypothetical protein